MFGFLRRRGGDASSPWGTDDAAADPAVPNDIADLLSRYLDELKAEMRGGGVSFEDAAKAIPIMSELLALPGERQCHLVVAAMLLRRTDNTSSFDRSGLYTLQSRLMRRKLPFTERQLAVLLESMPPMRSSAHCPERLAALAVERHVASNGLGAELRAAIEGVLARYREIRGGPDRWLIGAESEKVVWRLSAVLAGRVPQPAQPFAVEPDARDWLGRGAGPWSPWPPLLALFRKSCPARPDGRWLSEVAAAAATIDRELFVDRVAAILDNQGLPGHADPKGATLRQFAWAASTVADARLAAALRRLAKARYAPGYLDAIGNAAIRALAEMGTREAAGELGHLKQALRSKSVRPVLAEAIERVKETSGLSDADVEEIAVPDFGLDADGARADAFGGFEAVIRVADFRTVALTWRAQGGTGKAQKSVPAAVKRDHAPELAAVRATKRDIRDELRLQRRRLEELMADDRRWDLPVWRERYADHPLMGAVARDLVWRFEADGRSAAGVWRDGRPVDADDSPIAGFGDAATVRLWHPVDAAPGEVEAWRGWVRRHGVRQPFKQAYRECYAPTPAELDTRVYSNRFAGHFLREGRFASLRGARNWSGERIGMFDAGGSPTRRFEAAGVAASYDVDPVYGGPHGETGLPFYVSTDRVVFARAGEDVPGLPIEDVPPRVFSETMRDVDLFVSVCSIGADPNWEDRGASEEMRQYWTGYLDAPPWGSAETRRAVLADVLPRLKIADRCALDDRHVRVRGNRLSYRINLGSAAAFAEPSGRHLCIVPGPPSARSYERLLPFESAEDPVLAAILAKMFLLAADDQVVDPSIRYQIDEAANA